MAYGTYTWLNSEWSKGCSKLIRVAQGPGIEGFLCDRIVHGTGMTQWHIWDPGIICSDCLGHQIMGTLVQALLGDKQFLAVRTVISPIFLSHLGNITLFDKFGISNNFGYFDLGEGENRILSGLWGAHTTGLCTSLGKSTCGERRKEKEGVLVENGAHEERKRIANINR